MDPSFLFLVVLGLLFGWLIEWVIDWIWWRGPKKSVITNVPNLKAMLDKMPLQGNLQAKLATWFDDVMDRSSGEYKRRASKRALFIGTILAFAFNVDSIAIAKTLWREPTLRQVIVAQANNSEPQASLKQVEQLGIPVGWSTAPPTNKQNCEWTPGQNVYFCIKINGSYQVLNDLPPLNDLLGLSLKFLGLLISGIAAAQGAPFWFDILKKLINLRSSGPAQKSARSDNASAS